MGDNDKTADNLSILRDILCQPIVSQVKRQTEDSGKKVKNRRKGVRPGSEKRAGSPDKDAEDIADFLDVYIANELFSSFPPHVQSLSFEAIKNDDHLAQETADPLPATTIDSFLAIVPYTVIDSLEAYSIAEPDSLKNFLVPVYQEYVNLATSAPPSQDPSTRSPLCEICGRDWVPLTYHHLIPRQTHAKVLKRKWHEPWRLDSVAWLCRACHSFVHKIAGNEELAKDWWTVDLLMSREDVQAWAKWAAKLRWKGR